jgi:hypothetical protein
MTTVCSDYESSRLQEHIDLVKEAVQGWSKKCPYAFRHQANSELTRFSMIAEERIPPDRVGWALMVCDAFASLRCSLDHLAWAIIEHCGIRPRLTVKQQRQIAFPIVDDPDEFPGVFAYKMRYVDEPMRAVIERVQPYKRTNPDIPSFMSLLAHIDNVNKHKLLIPVSQAVGKLNTQARNIRPPLLAGDMLGLAASMNDVRDGTEVITLLTKPQKTAVVYDATIHIEAILKIEDIPGVSLPPMDMTVLFGECAREVRRAIEGIASFVEGHDKLDPCVR